MERHGVERHAGRLVSRDSPRPVRGPGGTHARSGGGRCGTAEPDLWRGRSSVGPGVPVAVSLERSAEMIPALLGILRAGGFYVPLDPAWPAARKAAILSSM